jgi:hypothetical protein
MSDTLSPIPSPYLSLLCSSCFLFSINLLRSHRRQYDGHIDRPEQSSRTRPHQVGTCRYYSLSALVFPSPTSPGPCFTSNQSPASLRGHYFFSDGSFLHLGREPKRSHAAQVGGVIHRGRIHAQRCTERYRVPSAARTMPWDVSRTLRATARTELPITYVSTSTLDVTLVAVSRPPLYLCFFTLPLPTFASLPGQMAALQRPVHMSAVRRQGSRMSSASSAADATTSTVASATQLVRFSATMTKLLTATRPSCSVPTNRATQASCTRAKWACDR